MEPVVFHGQLAGLDHGHVELIKIEAKIKTYKNNPTDKGVGTRRICFDTKKPWKPGAPMNKMILQTGFN